MGITRGTSTFSIGDGRLEGDGKTDCKWIRKLILNTPPQAGAYRSNGLHMYLILIYQAC